MSKHIKYLPLISKVETIDAILRTTTHSAFPVTEDNASPPGPKVPLLYRGKRLISEGEEEEEGETAFESSMYTYQKKGLPQGPSGNIQGSLATRRAGKMAEGEDQEGQKELVLHGMILRTQLVTLLKNNLFIDENEQVGACSGVCIYVCTCMYVCTYVCMYTYVHVCMHVHMYVCIRMYMYVCMYRGGSEQWTFTPRNSGLLTSFIVILGSQI